MLDLSEDAVIAAFAAGVKMISFDDVRIPAMSGAA
jgi:hypothetical protein